ncbi:HAMP domain-containing histidine kinase [Dyadobacter sp. LJ53]|uniref:sensor histidine kinase n=1 Tax=Dyadobacter chenwenxiniae TaxID=2906456 RepID=UPI001F252F92|nr:HAMP domain-containing sensor histidine kinase [Dyadobacter chenwenxiniae]MCF0048834.1 HAMP domain-containing histidine kinase [Dyadobacter chenwenxiniae]
MAEETNVLNIARIKVLSLSLHLRLVYTAMLLTLYVAENHTLQTERIGILMGVVILYYFALRLGLNWQKAIHIAILLFVFIIWSNLFFYEEGFHVVTLQYVVIISIYGFYGLGNKWGTCYSLFAILPFFIYMYLEQQFVAAVPWGPVGVSRLAIAILLLHNFCFLFLVNYYFFNSFYSTISTLDARTIELTSSLAFLEDSQEQLEAEFRHQKLLLATISHDIKSPLRFLMTTTGRLAKTNPDLPTIRAISQSSYRLYHFMKNLLDYAQFRYRSTRVTFNYLDVHDLVEQKFAIFLAEAESNGNRFLNAIPEGVILKNNVQLLSIVLHNLIDNANKVTNGGVIEVMHKDFRDSLHLIVRDTGPGMDPAIIRWLNSSEKVPGADLDPESFGMGLVIVKEVSTLIHAGLAAEPNGAQGVSISIIFQK